MNFRTMTENLKEEYNNHRMLVYIVKDINMLHECECVCPWIKEQSSFQLRIVYVFFVFVFF